MELIRLFSVCPAKPGCKNGKFFHIETSRKFHFQKKYFLFFIELQKDPAFIRNAWHQIPLNMLEIVAMNCVC